MYAHLLSTFENSQSFERVRSVCERKNRRFQLKCMCMYVCIYGSSKTALDLAARIREPLLCALAIVTNMCLRM